MRRLRQLSFSVWGPLSTFLPGQSLVLLVGCSAPGSNGCTGWPPSLVGSQGATSERMLNTLFAQSSRSGGRGEWDRSYPS